MYVCREWASDGGIGAWYDYTLEFRINGCVKISPDAEHLTDLRLFETL